MSVSTGDSRTRCRCGPAGCACTRSGQPVTTPPNLSRVLAAASRSGHPAATHPFEGASPDVLHWHAYLSMCEASGLPYGTPMDDRAQALADGYVRAHSAGRYDAADLLLATLRRRGGHSAALQARAAFDAAEVRVFGPAQALIRQMGRRQRVQDARALAQLADLERRMFGDAPAAHRALWRQIHPGKPYPTALRRVPVLRAGTNR